MAKKTENQNSIVDILAQQGLFPDVKLTSSQTRNRFNDLLKGIKLKDENVVASSEHNNDIIENPWKTWNTWTTWKTWTTWTTWTSRSMSEDELKDENDENNVIKPRV